MMRLWLCVILLCWQSIVCSEETSSLQWLIEGIKSLEAEFVQTTEDAKHKVIAKEKGKVWLKRPAKFRWETLGDTPRLIVSNGQKIWDFDKELEQVLVRKVASGPNQAPVFFLTGDPKRLEKDYQVTKVNNNSGKCLKHSNLCFMLKPKGDGNYQWIQVGFRQNVLREIAILDHLGQLASFQFSKVYLNRQIPDVRFQFTPPPHIDVVTHD